MTSNEEANSAPGSIEVGSEGTEKSVFPEDAVPTPRSHKEETTATPDQLETAAVKEQVSKLRAAVVITILAGVSFLNTMGSGILTVALPRIAQDLSLSPNLLFWPASVYALAAGCTLLIFGSLADVVGAKPMWQIGSGLYGIFTLACGLSKTGTQLITFRALLGICIAMCLPSAMSLTTWTFEPGKRRNICFACMGMGQPLGYSLGLILGGVFTDTIGWRYGYYVSAIINALLFAAAFKGFPSRSQPDRQVTHARPKLSDIDWTGACILSISMALVSYALAMITSNYQHIKDAYIIVLLCVAAILLPIFSLWVNRQERHGKPALIPNSLWKKHSFTATCVIVFFTWAVFNAFQYVSTLWFQRVHNYSALQTSLRFLPMIIVGASTNVFTGYVVDKISVRYLVFYSAIVTSIAPLMMALVPADWSYWRSAFVPMVLSPLHPDVLFTVSNLIISKAYPGQKQALAGGVFNAVSQLGNSVGLAVVAAIASSVSAHEAKQGSAEQSTSQQPSALLDGYQAGFWLMFGSMVLVCFISFWGLRKGGKVGSKDD